VWDARTGGLLGQIQLKERVQTHIWSPDSKTIALGGVNLWLWDVADKRATQWPEGSIATTRIAHLAYSPDGKLLAAVHNTAVKGNRCALRFWTVKDKKVHKAYEEPLVYDIAFCKSVPAFFFWPKPNNLPRKRNLVSDQDEPLEPPAEYPVLSYQPAIRHDDRTAYWYSLQDDGLIGYDMVLGKKTLFIPAKVGKVSNRTVVSPDGKWALTGFSDASKGPGNRVLLWNLDQKKLEKEYRGHQAGLRTLAFTNDNRSFITRDVDGNFFRWDVPIP
jgi:WD40 repeat protein